MDAIGTFDEQLEPNTNSDKAAGLALLREMRAKSPRPGRDRCRRE